MLNSEPDVQESASGGRCADRNNKAGLIKYSQKNLTPRLDSNQRKKDLQSFTCPLGHRAVIWMTN